jgi:hypothetical protein
VDPGASQYRNGTRPAGAKVNPPETAISGRVEIERRSRMELVLNLGWLVLATLMCWLWLHYAPIRGADRRIQIVALALIILILFPVISVTDDIVALQNPAETVSYERKDNVCAHAHDTLHPVVGTIPPLFAQLSFTLFCVAVLDNPHALAAKAPTMATVRNRPPPASPSTHLSC